jgi:GT2 family glycosyltransferase
MNTIAVIVLNWNGWQDTLRCLNSLSENASPSIRIYVVDNGSTDESLTKISDCHHEFSLIKIEKNLGWSGGNNVGITKARLDGNEFILLLNNDCIVKDLSIVTLANALKSDPLLGIAGPVIYDLKEPNRMTFGRAVFTEKSNMPVIAENIDEFYENPPNSWETAFSCGCAIMVRSASIDIVGMLDERYFLNYDETDWCARFRENGFGIKIIRDAKVWHKGSASIGGSNSPLNIYFLTRNFLLYAENHLSWTQRYYAWKSAYWDIQRRAQSTTVFGTVFFMLFPSGTLESLAARRGIVDYLLRRFGDCPKIIRQWQRQASTEKVNEK